MYKTYIETKHENCDRLGPSEMGYQIVTLWANSADDELIFFLISQKTGFDISCKLSRHFAWSAKTYILEKVRINVISKCRLLKFLPRMLSV